MHVTWNWTEFRLARRISTFHFSKCALYSCMCVYMCTCISRILESNRWMTMKILQLSEPGNLPLWGILQWSCWASTPATAEASLDEVNGVDVDQKWLVARWNEAGSVGTEWCTGDAAERAVVGQLFWTNAGATKWISALLTSLESEPDSGA